MQHREYDSRYRISELSHFHHHYADSSSKRCFDNKSILYLTSCIVVILFAYGAQYSYGIGNEGLSTQSISPKIVFKPWANDSNLSIESFSNGTSPFFRLQGTTGDTVSGFVTDDLIYTGPFVTIKIGNVSKSPPDAKVSLVLDVKGLFKDYLLSFVIGRGESNVWIGDNYFQKLDPYSTTDIDLSKVIALNNGLYFLIKKITLVVEKQTSIDEIDFAVQFDSKSK